MTGVDGAGGSRSSRPFDPGLQPERTALAWRRTGLALVVGSLVAFRVLPALLGPWAFVVAAAGVAVSIGVMVAAHGRHGEVHHLLTSSDDDRVALPGAALLAVVAAFSAAMGLLSVAVVVAS